MFRFFQVSEHFPPNNTGGTSPITGTDFAWIDILIAIIERSMTQREGFETSQVGQTLEWIALDRIAIQLGLRSWACKLLERELTHGSTDHAPTLYSGFEVKCQFATFTLLMISNYYKWRLVTILGIVFQINAKKVASRETIISILICCFSQGYFSKV